MTRMTKTIKCRRCSKTVEVNDDWKLKTCSVCLEKDRSYEKVKAEKRRLDREARQANKKLDFPIPEIFQSFSKFQQTYKDKNLESPTYEEYQQRREDYIKEQIRQKAEKQATEERSKFSERRKKFMRFLRFDLHPASDKDVCQDWRLFKMGYYKNQPMPKTLYEHELQCKNCAIWLENLDHTTLQSEDARYIALVEWSEDINHIMQSLTEKGMNSEVLEETDKYLVIESDFTPSMCIKTVPMFEPEKKPIPTQPLEPNSQIFEQPKLYVEDVERMRREQEEREEQERLGKEENAKIEEFLKERKKHPEKKQYE